MVYLIRFLLVLGVFGMFSCNNQENSSFKMPNTVVQNAEREFKLKIEQLSEAMVNNPGDAQNYLVRSIAYFDHGDFNEALVDINKAERLNPNNAEIAYYKAKIQFKKNDPNALNSAERSKDLGNQSIDIQLLLAEIYLKKKDFTAAKSYIQAAENIYPYSDNLQISKGNLQLLVGDTSTAFAYFKRAISFNNSSFDNYKNIIDNYYNLTIADSALKFTKIAMSKFPNRRELPEMKGQIFELAGVNDSAIAIYKKIMVSQTNRPDLLEKIANIHFKRRNFDSAFIIYDELFNKSNENQRYLYRAAECYEKKGQYEEALEYLEDEGDDFEDSPEMITRISRLENKLKLNTPAETDLYVAPEPAVKLKVAPKKPAVVKPSLEPEKRIFRGELEDIKPIQKRSGMNIKKDSIK